MYKKFFLNVFFSLFFSLSKYLSIKELNFASFTISMEFQYYMYSPVKERVFEKETMLYCSFCQLQLSSHVFFTLSLQYNEKLFHIWNLHQIYVLNNILHISMIVIKVAKN